LTEPSQTFSKQIRLLREAQGLSIRKLAHLLGVSTVTIWKWEKGDTVPRPRMLRLINEALNGQLGDVPTPTSARGNLFKRTSKGRREFAAESRPLANVIMDAKRMIAVASGIDPKQITVLIEY
jgi:transcriptional regulator with XRE-family HTH domain